MIFNVKSNLLYIIIIVLLIIKPIYSTSIVCIFKNNVITIGADSRTTITNFTDSRFSLSCKILQVDSFYIAFSGMTNYNDANFYLGEIAKNTLSCPGSIREKIISFRDSLGFAFKKTIDYIKIKTPSVYSDTSNLNDFRCNVLVLGIEDTIPFIYSIQYKVKELKTTNRDNIAKEFKGIYSSTSGRFRLGERDYINKFEETDSTYWKKNDPIDVIKFFIGLEIENSRSVGPPIDILQIDKTGGIWIQRKRMCDNTIEF